MIALTDEMVDDVHSVFSWPEHYTKSALTMALHLGWIPPQEAAKLRDAERDMRERAAEVVSDMCGTANAAIHAIRALPLSSDQKT